MPRRKARCPQGKPKSVKFQGMTMHRQRVTCPTCGLTETGVWPSEWSPVMCLKGHNYNRKTGEALTEKQASRLAPEYAQWTPPKQPKKRKLKIKIRRKR